MTRANPIVGGTLVTAALFLPACMRDPVPALRGVDGEAHEQLVIDVAERLRSGEIHARVVAEQLR